MSGVLPKTNFAASSVPGGVHAESGTVLTSCSAPRSGTFASRSGTFVSSATSTVTR